MFSAASTHTLIENIGKISMNNGLNANSLYNKIENMFKLDVQTG